MLRRFPRYMFFIHLFVNHPNTPKTIAPISIIAINAPTALEPMAIAIPAIDLRSNSLLPAIASAIFVPAKAITVNANTITPTARTLRCRNAKMTIVGAKENNAQEMNKSMKDKSVLTDIARIETSISPTK